MTTTKKAKRGALPNSYRHVKSRRTKIPTESDDQYLADNERESAVFYPDARSKDGTPRLSWRRNTGRKDVAREASPLYIQEKVDPSWFINHLIDQTDEAQTHLLSFNGYPEDAKYSWYHHKGNWSNRIIHGDTAKVMASFLHREGMKGEVQLIYFDPPYGINFDNMFQTSTKKTKGGAPSDSTSKRAFRDTYKDGVHSYMDSIYRIATYSRMLLKDSGSFFLQIGSEHVHRTAIILDEVFGAENRVATIPFATTGASSTKLLPDAATWLLWYARDKKQVKFRKLYVPLESRKEQLDYMSYAAMIELPSGKIRNLTKEERKNPDLLPDEARLFRRMQVTSQHESDGGRSAPFVWEGVKYECPKDRQWSVSHDGLKRLVELDRLVSTNKKDLSWKIYADEVPGRKLNNIWHTQMAPSDKHFIVETDEEVIERCVLMATDPGDLVLDPTCGSGTTAFVAEKWGRRWITIDINPVQISLCRQRIITAINDWYLTQDSDEGRRKEAELAGREPSTIQNISRQQYDPSSGFVYERIPYVSAATLAYDRKPDAVKLVNQPLKKRGMKRISSPFTVESASPHKYVNTREYEDHNDVFSTVLEAVGVAGIIMPGSSDRWHLEDANAWPSGTVLTHEARLRETGEKVAVVLLADDNTAGVNLINHAAEEATGYPRIKNLFVLAFEFEAIAYGKQTEKRGKLQIHKIKINNDLALKELMHKKDDSSFVMLGEPDIDVRQHGKNKWIVRVNGYDTFNPETGNIHSGRADTIDCWMLDTNYDGQSFFTRRIYLPDKENDRQIKNLKNKLAKKINSKHWDAMTSLESLPFDTPKSGRIAVRVITEYGEVMTTIHEVQSSD